MKLSRGLGHVRPSRPSEDVGVERVRGAAIATACGGWCLFFVSGLILCRLRGRTGQVIVISFPQGFILRKLGIADVFILFFILLLSRQRCIEGAFSCGDMMTPSKRDSSSGCE